MISAPRWCVPATSTRLRRDSSKKKPEPVVVCNMSSTTSSLVCKAAESSSCSIKLWGQRLVLEHSAITFTVGITPVCPDVCRMRLLYCDSGL